MVEKGLEAEIFARLLLEKAAVGEEVDVGDDGAVVVGPRPRAPLAPEVRAPRRESPSPERPASSMVFERFYRRREIAALLRVHVNSIARYQQRGWLKGGIAPSGIWLFPESELYRFLSTQHAHLGGKRNGR